MLVEVSDILHAMCTTISLP